MSTKEPNRDQILAAGSGTTVYGAVNGGKVSNGYGRRGDGGSFDAIGRRKRKELWRGSQQSHHNGIQPLTSSQRPLSSLPTISLPSRVSKLLDGKVNSQTPIRQLALPKDFPPAPTRAGGSELAQTVTTAPSGHISTYVPTLYEGPSEPTTPAPSFPYAPLAPPGWRAHWSGRFCQWYYRDIGTGKSQWLPPSYQ